MGTIGIGGAGVTWREPKSAHGSEAAIYECRAAAGGWRRTVMRCGSEPREALAAQCSSVRPKPTPCRDPRGVFGVSLVAVEVLVRGVWQYQPNQMSRSAKQYDLPLRKRDKNGQLRGGKRPGAGRKAVHGKAGLPHRSRPKLASRYPVLITQRVIAEFHSLRTKERMKVFRDAFRKSQREDFRITDWSVQRDHIHFVAEAHDAIALAQGVRRFGIRVAKGLNQQAGRKGPAFTDRFHSRILKTPREVRNALAYTLNNARHHHVKLVPWNCDPCSSGAWFEGWREPPPDLTSTVASQGPPPQRPVGEPHTWLRSTGWRRHGLIRLDEVPGPHPK